MSATTNAKDIKDLTGLVEKLANMMLKAEKVTASSNKTKKDSIKIGQELTEQYAKRGKALNKTIPLLNQQNKQFELLSYNTYKLYTAAEQGGNMFEYLDLALSSANEQVKILGVEATIARKIMYGFLPPGMFRIANKFSTVLRFMGGTVRLFKGDLAQTDTLFKKVGKGFGKVFSGKTKRIETAKAIKDAKALAAIEMKTMKKRMKKADGGSGPRVRGTAVAKIAMSGKVIDEDHALYSKVKEMRENKSFVKLMKSRTKILNKANKVAEKAKIRADSKVITDKLNAEIDAATTVENNALQVISTKANIDLQNFTEGIRRREKLIEEESEKSVFYYQQSLVIKEKMEEEVIKRLGIKKRLNDPIYDKKRSKIMKELETSTAGKKHKMLIGQKDNADTIVKETKKEVFAGKLAQREFKEIKKKMKDRMKRNKFFARFKKMSNSIKGFFRSIQGLLQMYLRTAIGAMLIGLVSILAGLIVLRAIWPSIKKAIKPAMAVLSYGIGVFMKGFGTIFEGISKIWNSVFNGGSMMDLITGLAMILWGLLEIAWGLIVILLGTLIVFLAAVVADLLLQAWNWVMGLKADMESVGKVVGLVVAVLGMIAAYMLGAPIIVILAVGLLMYAVGKWIVSNMEGPALYATIVGIAAIALAVAVFFFTWPVVFAVLAGVAIGLLVLLIIKHIDIVISTILAPFKFIMDFISDTATKIREALEDDQDKGIFDRTQNTITGDGRGWFGGGKARGGVTDGRINLVGEEGPELVRLPKGSRVHSNAESKQMMGGVTNNINITINAKDTSDTELRRIADKIGNMVNNKINRRTSSGTMR